MLDQRWGITVLRIVIGFVFLMNGGELIFDRGMDGVARHLGRAGFPAPMFFAVVFCFSQLLGGAALVLGIFSRYAGFVLGFNMLLLLFTVHLHKFSFPPKHIYYEMVLIAASVAVGFLGSGKYALDNKLRRRHP